ncbi:MAG TPA: outer membrane lipoprotein carrier protein LolA [Bacteroidia bacterium]|nr:outer membrane lipoprotein carrier protein LolA [Bacteroidia bacterium]HRH07227.1 outer membrane lipoprotein carrier protein LolA [Bacteroidia bacterium]HRH63556.1 outer membrane lipoprotein carrier protein LolA [Bacteroidia bacterium]
MYKSSLSHIISKNLLLLLILVLVVSSAVTAQNKDFKTMKDTAVFKQKLLEKSKATNSIESNFTQEKNLSMLSEKIISKGHFYFKKTNLLRWEYLSPTSYLIVINKDKIFIKDGKKVSKYDTNSNKLFKGINDMMLNSVQGNVLNHTDFKINYFENDTYYLVEMTPRAKEMKSYIKTISMYFDKTDYTVSKIKTVELSDDYTSIEFSNKKLNQAIADSQFSVK